MPDLISKVDSLRVYQQGDRRAPHKPLLLLVALGRLQRGEDRLARFKEWTEALLPLLESYAPPVVAHHEPQRPYWHLRSDDLWEVTDADRLPLQANNFPKMEALRGTSAGIGAESYELLRRNPQIAEQVAQHILARHFPRSLHPGLLEAVGIDPDFMVPPPDFDRATDRKRASRDPKFPLRVKEAYEHRCAVTGFRADLGGSHFGVEAAHVRARAYEGPDDLDNGVLLNPLMHLLFDRGAWTLTDDRRVLVSARFNGSPEAVRTLRELHGREVTPPRPGFAPVAVKYIRWHREPEQGGVFRTPPLALPK